MREDRLVSYSVEYPRNPPVTFSSVMLFLGENSVSSVVHAFELTTEDTEFHTEVHKGKSGRGRYDPRGAFS